MEESQRGKKINKNQRPTWNPSEGKTEQYISCTQNAVECFSKNGLTNKTRIVQKAGLGTYGRRKEHVSVIKKPGSRNGLEFHICCSLKRAPAAQKERERERERAREC